MVEPDDVLNMKKAISQVLNSEDCQDQDSVSLFEVLSIYHEIKADKKRVKDEIEDKLNKKLKSINPKYSATIQDFESDTNNICIVVKKSAPKEKTKFYFKKNNGILEVAGVKGYSRFNDVLGLMGVYVEKWYDYCDALRQVEEEGKFNINSVNSAFFVNISYACICIYYNKTHVTSDFKILSLYDDSLNFYCMCRNNDITTFMKNKENQFLSNIFVKISDCPEWMQKHLILERQSQIEEIEAKKEAKMLMQAKLAKKQKRREFWKKIFPFIK